MEDQDPSIDHKEDESTDSREDHKVEANKELLLQALVALSVTVAALAAVFIIGMPIATLWLILACYALSLVTEVLARYSPIALVIGWTLSLIGGLATVENWSKADNSLSVTIMLLLCIAGPLVVYHKFKSRQSQSG